MSAKQPKKNRGLEEVYLIFSKLTEFYQILIAGDRGVFPNELKRQVVAPNLRCPSSMKMLSKSIYFGGLECQWTLRVSSMHERRACVPVRI